MPDLPVLLATELSASADEGMRNWVRQAATALSRHRHRVDVVRLPGNPRIGVATARRPPETASDSQLVYVPYSGLTSASIARLAVLRARWRVRDSTIVVLQASPDVRTLPWKPTRALFASQRLADKHPDVAGIQAVFPPAIDTERFSIASDGQPALRSELGLDPERPVALHVGHLKASRNLMPLATLARAGEVNVVVLGSTSTVSETGVRAELERAGVRVHVGYVPDVERWYQMADVYVFPVVDLQGSIEVPLTVLEAMACGKPVVTTPFGGLPERFSDAPALELSSVADILGAVNRALTRDGRQNRDHVVRFTVSGLGTALAESLDEFVA